MDNTCDAAFERIWRIVRMMYSYESLVFDGQQWFESHPLRQFSVSGRVKPSRKAMNARNPGIWNVCMHTRFGYWRLALAAWVLVLLCAIPPAAGARQLAITIDDLDLNADDTPLLSLEQRNDAILAVLRERQIQSVIFVCGMRVDNPVGLRHVRSWGEAGHLVANHSYSHWYFPGRTVEEFSADILRNEKLIADTKGFTRLFRFPMLKEGRTREQRDGLRTFLRQQGYRNGHVTIDTSEWAIDARLRARLKENPDADLTPYRQFYLEHMLGRVQYYDDLARRVLGRSPKHTLLVHHNLVSALFLADLIRSLEERGWQIISPQEAFADPVFAEEPDVLPAGESLVWALARHSGRFDDELRYPGEDGKYEESRMNELGL